MISNTERAEELILKGKLTVGNTQEIFTRVWRSFDNTMDLKIYLYENTEIDLAFLQILFSLFEAAHRLNKNLSVLIDDPTVIWDLIVKAGFETHFSIDIDPTGTDFHIESNFQ